MKQNGLFFGLSKHSVTEKGKKRKLKKIVIARKSNKREIGRGGRKVLNFILMSIRSL
jgi:hypothetical protein